MDKKFLKAFVEILRNELAAKNEVSIEGLGTFRIEHRKQHQKKFDNGSVQMMPPGDHIEFLAEKTKET